MVGSLLLGLCLLSQQGAADVMKSNQEAALKMVRESGIELTNSSSNSLVISRNDLQLRLGVAGINVRQSEQGFAILKVWRFYRPSNHVSMQAIEDPGESLNSSVLRFYQRINGDIEARASVPLRRDQTPQQVRDILNHCFNDLLDAYRKGGLKTSDGSLTPFPDDDKLIDMAKVVDHLSDQDLVYLTDKVWGWKDNSPRGHTGPWSHSIVVNGVRIAIAHPENMVDIGPANGIGLSGRIWGTTKIPENPKQELQEELGAGIKVFSAAGTKPIAFGVQALIEYGNGISLQEVHDRISRFASVMAKHQ